MPEGTRVHKAYIGLRRKGHSKESAAKIAQKQTGQSLQTGRKPKKKEKQRG